MQIWLDLHVSKRYKRGWKDSFFYHFYSYTLICSSTLLHAIAKNQMTIVYSILLLSFISAPIDAGNLCTETVGNVKCCTAPKPLECVHMTPTDQTKDARCNCIPTDPRHKDEEFTCSWSAKRPQTTNFGELAPCYGFHEMCSPAVLQGQPPSKCHIGYPPPAHIMKETSSEYYCQLDTSKFDVYNVFFTCWLYPCKNRFEKPPETKSTEWCYPPTIMDGSLAKKILKDDGESTFCERYTVDSTVEYYDVNKNGTSFCLLPPLCKSGTNTTDTDKFMPTNYMKKGTSNMDHGQLNPYAAIDCIRKRNCVEGETSKTHFCDDIPATSAPEGEGGDSDGMSMATIIVVSIVGVLLFIVLVLIAVIVFLRSRKPPKKEPLLSPTICYPGCSKEHVNEEAA